MCLQRRWWVSPATAFISDDGYLGIGGGLYYMYHLFIGHMGEPVPGYDCSKGGCHDEKYVSVLLLNISSAPITVTVACRQVEESGNNGALGRTVEEQRKTITVQPISQRKGEGEVQLEFTKPYRKAYTFCDVYRQ